MTQQNTHTNRRIVLNSRPNGAPEPENFRLDTSPVPAITEGEVLLRTVFLSLDPYMRGGMSDGPSYAPPVELNRVMVGAAVCRVANPGTRSSRSVIGCYFDDRYWTVRHLVANTGNWLTGRQVLISPYALVAAIKAEEHIAIDLTKKQIEESPSLTSDKPVSRQFEESYYG